MQAVAQTGATSLDDRGFYLEPQPTSLPVVRGPAGANFNLLRQDHENGDTLPTR